MRKLLLFIGILFFSTLLFAGNNIKIIADSTNNHAQFEISRNKSSKFRLKFKNENGETLFKTTIRVNEKPQIVSLNWKEYNKGIYIVELKNRNEKVKLLFIKK